ncbi:MULTISPECIES: N-acetylmuramoyl-L-alanine amidase family protein [Oceanobacillus]|uniref:N-acetylmuramoyl-L-alanine amidase family protein n=1 Tax=Oceanobacillus TaxID=182709 RepID=UPI002116E0D3|nr:N-acetylmuramoyl-L-alanine amidase [Oceanobacillus oncorhynchi]UUI41293.1 N-acetylmuramoyl-L-alanine amidase [Oceanobacillus oncorhynchi]
MTISHHAVEAANTRIYIDPGHGGADPGASANGLQEKDVTLDIALRTRDILNEQYSSHTIKLSRTSDVTKSLDARTNEANNWGANFFVSIHINAGNSTGYESFTWNGSYENKERTNAIRKTIHNETVEQTGFTDRGKKEANLHVLRESSAPAILTENGFIDNAADADKLKNAASIEKIAQGHADGIAKALGLPAK